MKRLLLPLCLFSQAVFAGSYRVAPGPHGSIRFTVEGPIDDVKGESRSVEGHLDLDPAAWANGHGVVGLPLDTVRTGIPARDADMREEFLQTSRFPFALLTIDKIERPSATAIAKGQGAEGEAVGTFELHGVRRAVRFTARARLDADGTLWVSGKFAVPFADYNIQRPQRLFFKLGDVADVFFDVAFTDTTTSVASAPTPKVPLQPTVTEVLPLAPPPKPRPPRKPKPQIYKTFAFKGDEPKAKGEHYYYSPEIGGSTNKLTCAHCHARGDERAGLVQADGYARPAHTLFNSAQRPRFWNGFATDAGKAADICQKIFMQGQGLTEAQRSALLAFIEAISPDPSPELDYRTLYRTYESSIRDPAGGDPVRGKELADKYCMTCHLDGRVGPVWAPGLYEADWVVKRVRRLEGHGNRFMPPFSIERLPDTDLRDIVTFLTHPKVAPPIFDRSKRKTLSQK
ncbi:MAG: c-type cytochrome [Myxococcaceae bacterium]|nr:c-type cytochrome [Myxococcaceae bacterium]